MTWAARSPPSTPPDDGVLRLEKQAPTVSYGAHCDDLFTTVRRHPDAEAGDQVLVLHHTTETELEPPARGTRSACAAPALPGFVVRAEFDAGQILAAPFSTVMNESIVPLSHILWSHVWLGIATEAFERGRAFVRAAARRKPGEPVPAAHSLSRVMSELTMLRAEVQSALARGLRRPSSAEPGRERAVRRWRRCCASTT